MNKSMDEIEKEIETERAAGEAWAKAHSVTLERVQTYPRMSQETTAFNADLVQVTAAGRVVVGMAENDGHGGATFYHFSGPGAGEFVLNPDVNLEGWIDAQVWAIEEQKIEKAFIKRAHTEAKKKALNLALLKIPGEPMSYYVTKESSAEAFVALYPEYAGKVFEFHIYRTDENAKAARIANENKFIAKVAKSAALRRCNYVIERREDCAGFVISKAYYTKAESVTEFIKARPETDRKGFTLTLICISK